MNISVLNKIKIGRSNQHLAGINNLIIFRNESTPALKKNDDEKRNCDLVGQPHPVSNLRVIKFHIPNDETEIERRFRLKREEVQKWNEQFWTKHNSNFHKERKEFIALHEKETTLPDGAKEPISADKLSVFYKRFLDKNWKTHLNYNYEWYKKNAMLIILALRVKVNRLTKSITHRSNDNKDNSNTLT